MGLVQAKKAYELLSQGNCGGNLGKVYPPVGGCEQAVPDGPTAAPTPGCTSDSECDDGDSCTLNTCNNGLCVSTPDCASCGKSKVDVEITIDNYGDETTYEIKDSSNSKVMGGSGWPANSVNSFWQCFLPVAIHSKLRTLTGTEYVAHMEMAVTLLRSMINKLHLEVNLAVKKQNRSKLVQLLQLHLLPYLLQLHLLQFQLHLLLLLLPIMVHQHLTPPTPLLQCTPRILYLQCTRQVVYLQILCPLLTLPMSHQLFSLLDKLVNPRANLVASIMNVAVENAI